MTNSSHPGTQTIPSATSDFDAMNANPLQPATIQSATIPLWENFFEYLRKVESSPMQLNVGRTGPFQPEKQQPKPSRHSKPTSIKPTSTGANQRPSKTVASKQTKQQKVRTRRTATTGKLITPSRPKMSKPSPYPCITVGPTGCLLYTSDAADE